MNNNKRDTSFVIGIGSQRAGSTLLHEILSACTSVYMHPVKELHYYDTLFDLRQKKTLKEYSIRQLDREIKTIVDAVDMGFINKRYKNFLRTNYLLATKNLNKLEYIDLYRPCVSDHSVMGEITPEYMLLPEAGIIQMKADLGDDAKIILIARNPIKRIISAFKLLNNYTNLGLENDQAELIFKKHIDETSGWMSIQDQFNDYVSSINRYKKQFKNVLMIAYDDFFASSEKLAKTLEEFLQTDVDGEKLVANLATRKNELGENFHFSEQIITALELRYKEHLQAAEHILNRKLLK